MTYVPYWEELFEDDDSFSALSKKPTSFRAGVMVIIFFVSLIAVAFPDISKRSRYLRIPKTVFFIGKHFGTGVILSTAFCHLLQEAFESLQSPVVKQRYNNIGKWTGLILLSGLLAIFLVEYISSSYVEHLYSEHSLPSTPASTPSRSRSRDRKQKLSSSHNGSAHCSSSLAPEHDHERSPLLPRSIRRKTSRSSVPRPTHLVISTPDPHLTSIVDVINSPRPGLMRKGTQPEHNEYFALDRGCPIAIGSKCKTSGSGDGKTPLTARTILEQEDVEEDEGTPSLVSDEDDERPKVGRRRQIVGILILQLGIMIHSAAIGLTLAVVSGSDFTSLTTAIIFHQLFEGLSLGIRIAAVPPPPDRPPTKVNWFNVTLTLLFAVTTPLGMGIGLIAFNDRRGVDGAQMQLTQGLLSAISASMLIYAGTVEMLAGDFVFGSLIGGHGHGGQGHAHGHAPSDEGEEDGKDDGDHVSVGKQVLAVVSLLAGVLGMELVGLGE